MTQSESPDSESFRLTFAIVACFCLVFIGFVFAFLDSATPTFDENVYLPSGYTYLKWSDYRMDPEHPPLVKKLAALPLLFQQVWPVQIEPGEEDFSPSNTFSSGRLLRLSWAIALELPNSQWNFCHQFLYGITEQTQQSYAARTPLLVPTTSVLGSESFYNRPDRLIMTGRVAVLSLGLMLGILIFAWSHQFHNALAPAVLSLVLFVFDPNFIAHSGLIGTDVPLAMFMTATVFSFWRLCRRFDALNALCFLVAFAFAFVTKFSAFLLIPIFWLIALGRIFNSTPWPVFVAASDQHSPTKRFLMLLGLFLAGCMVTWAIIWLFYDLRFSAASDPQQTATEERPASSALSISHVDQFRLPGHFPIEMDVRRADAIKLLRKDWPKDDMPEELIRNTANKVQIGSVGRCILFAYDHKLLPESYLAGFARTRIIALHHPSFLRGNYSDIGFTSYFLWTFLLKTPLPALTLIVTAIGLAIIRRIPWRSDLSFLVIPVVIYFAFAVSTNLDIGHRHILPIYPFLYVLGALTMKELASVAQPKWQQRCAGVALCVLGISSSFVFLPPWHPQSIYPHYLSYFNEFGGGPLNGWRSLADSNIDWGQDLKGLKKWLDRSRLSAPIYLAYFGTTDPRYYQIVHRPVPKALGGYPATIAASDGQNSVHDFINGLRPGDHIAVSVQNLIGASLSPEAREVWRQILERCTLVDRIGYSIFVFRCNDNT